MFRSHMRCCFGTGRYLRVSVASLALLGALVAHAGHGCYRTSTPVTAPEIVEDIPNERARSLGYFSANIRFGFCFRGTIHEAFSSQSSALGDSVSTVVGHDGSVVAVGRGCKMSNPPDLNIEGTFQSGYDVVISKLSPDGEFLWGKILGALDDVYATDVALSGDGSLFVIGRLSGIVDFDAGPQVAERRGYGDVFVTKLSPDGDLLWAITFGGPGEHDAQSVTVLHGGEVAVVGRMGGEFYPDPESRTDLRRLNEEPGSNEGDAFVVTLNPDTGEVIWAQTFGGPGRDEGIEVAPAPDGGLVMTGNFQRTVDFDPGPESDYKSVIQGSMDSSVFVVRLDPDGSYRWTRTLHRIARHVAVASDGSTFVNRDSWSGVTVTKLSDDGGHLWSRGISWHRSVSSKILMSTPSGAVVMAGTFRHTVDFDPSPDEDVLRCPSRYNAAFVTLLGPEGEYDGTLTFEAERETTFESVALSPDGRAIFTNLTDPYSDPLRRSLFFSEADVSELIAGSSSGDSDR